jgi:copper oxidase (laccase) domain-containing protein
MTEVTLEQHDSRIINTIEPFPGLLIAESGRALGNMDTRFSERHDVAAARARLRGSLPIEETYVVMARNSDDFVDLTAGDLATDRRMRYADRHQSDVGREIFPGETAVVCDGLITNRSNVGLMLNAGDCMPIVVYQPNRNLLALIHLGWSGTVKGLHRKMIDYMLNRHRFDPASAVAYFGSSIRKESYLKKAVSDLQLQDPTWHGYCVRHGDYYAVDIPGFVAADLRAYGMAADNIKISEVDTGASPRHFSVTRHRIFDEPDGRNGFVAAMAMVS